MERRWTGIWKWDLHLPRIWLVKGGQVNESKDLGMDRYVKPLVRYSIQTVYDKQDLAGILHICTKYFGSTLKWQEENGNWIISNGTEASLGAKGAADQRVCSSFFSIPFPSIIIFVQLAGGEKQLVMKRAGKCYMCSQCTLSTTTMSRFSLHAKYISDIQLLKEAMETAISRWGTPCLLLSTNISSSNFCSVILRSSFIQITKCWCISTLLFYFVFLSSIVLR